MKHTMKVLPQSQVELTITVPPEEYQNEVKKAAQRLSQRVAIKGFRKGNVPFEILKKEVGEMTIMQEALELIIQTSFFEAVQAEKLETIGMPKIDVEKLAPQNEVVYKATVTLLPKVELPDVKQIKVEYEVKPVEEKQIDETIDALRGMQAKEVLKEGKATGNDKLIIDMDMFLDKVPVEGGQAKDYQVYLSEDHYIPGFNKHVEGLQKNDEKEFQLEFPKDHYQKMLAGKKVDFKVKVKDVFERQLPEMTEEFAKTLGQESVAKLREIIQNNLYEEAKQKADQKFEIEILEKLIEKTKFDEIPELLIDSERQKMFYELKRDLEKNGVSIEQYLMDIKKKENELFEEFRTQAEKRAKAALLSRTIAKENNLAPSDEEIHIEIDALKNYYHDNTEALENLKRHEVHDSIATMIQNKKVMSWLKEQVKA